MKNETKRAARASVETDQYMQTLIAGITEKLTEDLREALSSTLENQISTTLAEALLEGEFYRRISKDMRTGLRKIHKEISATSKPNESAGGTSSLPPTGESSSQSVAESARANQLFSEASSQLTEVLVQTENATVTIMEAVERQFSNQSLVADLLARVSGEENKYAISELEALQVELDTDLNSILMALSFQDLTGQRIKRAVAALQEIESTTVELYLSTGLLIQAHEETPVENLDRLTEQTRETVEAFASQSVVGSELKGPSGGADQANIDDLLKQLGMD